MYLGYNTNGFAFHRLEDSLEILAEIGYRGVAVTLDYGVLNPYDPTTSHACAAVRRQLEQRGLRCVIETGARFLLDPRRKHQPTLISPDRYDRARRADFLIRSIEIASFLNAELVSFWSGTPVDDAPASELNARFDASLKPVLDAAEKQRIALALEAEPGMWIDTLASAESALERIDHPDLGLTVDLGHLHCQREGELPALIRRSSSQLRNIHIEDMRAGVHEHLMFGEGEMDFPSILRSLSSIAYEGGVHVELSRHSHNAVEVAGLAFEFLQECLDIVEPD